MVERKRSSGDGVIFEEGKNAAWMCAVGGTGCLMVFRGQITEPVLREVLAWHEQVFPNGTEWGASDLLEVSSVDTAARELVTTWSQGRAARGRTLLLFRSRLLEMSVQLYKLFTKSEIDAYSDPARYDEAVRKLAPRYARCAFDSRR